VTGTPVANVLRVREPHGHARVTFVELFFDLVFVFAVTQLSHALFEHFGAVGAGETLLLLLAVWWVWIDTSWVTNWLDPGCTAVRLMLFALMLAGLVLSSAIPEAFASRGWVFGWAYACMQVVRCGFMLWALYGHDARNFRNFQRITVWRIVASAFWVAGGHLEGAWRIAFWVAALALDTLAPAVGFRVPGLGRSTVADWHIDGAHMAERCALFIIIALGESILVTGAALADLDWSGTTLAAFASAFVGSVAMWWIYFNVGAERGSASIAAAADPGRMARAVYTYLHMLLVAGIVVVAVADHLVLAHPYARADAEVGAAIVGGPALYLLGNLLFKRTSAPRFALSHLVGGAMLAVLATLHSSLTCLELGTATTIALVVVAAWETLSLRPARA
jgi:low temperature requirement protein LtrA